MKIIVGLVILAAFCLGMLCFHYCSSFFRSRRLRARFDRGRQGEEEAREYLCAAGFEILAEQAEQIGLMYVDEEEVECYLNYVFVPVELNTASEEDIKALPGVGKKMTHEFEEYRPYKSMEQFRKEIGKYVDDNELKRLERLVYLKDN